jgi:hypothetical protein
MRITVRRPDDLGEEVKRRTENVGRSVMGALTEKIKQENRRRVRQEILDMAAGDSVDSALHEQNQRMRRQRDQCSPGRCARLNGAQDRSCSINDWCASLPI